MDREHWKVGFGLEECNNLTPLIEHCAPNKDSTLMSTYCLVRFLPFKLGARGWYSGVRVNVDNRPYKYNLSDEGSDL